MDDSRLGHPLKILVVDDNDANCAYAAAVMEDEGFDVETASCASDGVHSFLRFEPDCVLLDVKMPDRNGFIVCRELRALPRGSSAAIIFVTAVRTAESFDIGMAAGADDFITKPVLANELVGRVRFAVRARALSAGVHRLHEIFVHHRTELARLGALDPVLVGAPKLRVGLDQLSEQMDQMLMLTEDSPRGA